VLPAAGLRLGSGEYITALNTAYGNLASTANAECATGIVSEANPSWPPLDPLREGQGRIILPSDRAKALS
jgi:hypothetical protein